MNYKQIKSLPKGIVQNLVDSFLLEDAPDGDISSENIFDSQDISSANISTREDIILSGVALFPFFFDNSFEIKSNFEDGDFVKKGEIIATISGNTIKILKAERIILNLMQRMSAISTLTNKYKKIVETYGVKILDTRKTTPGLRIFEKYAVVCGGGTNHRFDLSSGVMIKDNHISAAETITKAVEKSKSSNHGKPIEVEIDTFAQLREALDCGVDILLLDNFSPSDTLKALEIIDSHEKGKAVFVESSGGITLDTLEEYAKTKVDAISVGALTHSAGSVDIGFDFV
jgi:nicotinate-nucleotide pyrophosphorylase (carboxylating)